MIKNHTFKLATLAASIALAMASTAALAAAPTATQLPGAGKVAAGAATGGTITAGAQTITFTGNTVINWGVASGATINATTQPGGFNIGSGASLGFTDSASAGSGVLNVDVSGNPSQILGAMTMNAGGGNLYVANANGIIVGATATISGPVKVGLIANTLGTVAFDGTNSATSIEYTGGGGNVTVLKGATIDGTNVIVSGGGVVNVDLSAFTSGNARLYAGVKNSTSAWAADNPGAALTTTGSMGGATLAGFQSAGDASTSGVLTLPGAVAGGSGTRVDGTLTNTGALTLTAGFDINGALINNKTVTQLGNASMGSLINNGAYNGGNFALSTTDGGLTNSGQITNATGSINVTGGDLTNNGQISTGGTTVTDGNLVNGGVVTGGGAVNVTGGNFTNSGSMVASGVEVINGSVTNSGALDLSSSGFGNVLTASDTSTGMGFTSGADYSITNTGTITGGGQLVLVANADISGLRNTAAGTTNDSTGSVINGSTGVLQVGSGGQLGLAAYNDVTVGGSVQALSGTKYKALSATNPLGVFEVVAGDYDYTGLNTDGVATVSAPITVSTSAGLGTTAVVGNQVNLLGNLSVVDASGNPSGSIDIIAGAQQASGYAVRVGSGATVSADSINVAGDVATDNPNVLVNGTLAANAITFGNAVFPGGPPATGAISNLYTGPSGSLVMYNNGTIDPYLTLDFTGTVKTVPYNNAPNNFRFNGLNVNVADGSDLTVELDPVAYATNGTSNGLSAVNLLVNSNVILQSDLTATAAGAPGVGGTAVTGVTNLPNTHLVLQSSGSITTQGDAVTAFYWPGYVYLGNVAANADGSAAPGTLGLGTITTLGDFSNVMPGDIGGASGIHFITQFPMTLGGNVITNANAWVNFGTDLMTQAYSSGTLGANAFFGGTQGSGTVVNYGALDPSNFVTQAPSATP